MWSLVTLITQHRWETDFGVRFSLEQKQKDCRARREEKKKREGFFSNEPKIKSSPRTSSEHDLHLFRSFFNRHLAPKRNSAAGRI